MPPCMRCVATGNYWPPVTVTGQASQAFGMFGPSTPVPSSFCGWLVSVGGALFVALLTVGSFLGLHGYVVLSLLTDGFLEVVVLCSLLPQCLT